MKDEEELVDELFEGASDFEESDLEAADEGFEEDSSDDEDGGGGDGRGSATKLVAVRIRADGSEMLILRALLHLRVGSREWLPTQVVLNRVFDHFKNKRKAKKSQLRFALVQ